METTRCFLIGKNCFATLWTRQVKPLFFLHISAGVLYRKVYSAIYTPHLYIKKYIANCIARGGGW